MLNQQKGSLCLLFFILYCFFVFFFLAICINEIVRRERGRSQKKGEGMFEIYLPKTPFSL